MKLIQYIPSLIFILMSLVACQTTKHDINQLEQEIKKCGKTRGSFLGSWFDYYERGLSYADCEMWTESEQDLRQALTKRSIDKRRVYSLGMHLISDYFPNRELGISLFFQKKYSEAEKQLKISLSQFPTSKAQEYLTRVHVLQLSKNNTDTHPPEIRIDTPKANSIKTDSTIRVTGNIKDDSFIDKVEINGIPYIHAPIFITDTGIPIRITSKVSSMDFSLEVPVQYKHGQALIEIVATDISGKKTTRSVNVILDQLGPQINIQTAEKLDNGQYHIILDARDKHSDIKLVSINGKTYQVNSKKIKHKQTGGITHEIYLDEVITGPFNKDHILIIATDSAGNKTRAELTSSNNVEDYQDKPIEILIQNGDKQRSTFEKVAYIEGEVESTSLIIQLLVNGKNILTGQAKHVYFNYSPDLKLGTNTFHLVTENQQGYKEQSQIEVIRKTPPNRSIKERLKVAQFPFPCNRVSRTPCYLSADLYQSLNNKLTKRQRFQLTNQNKINQLLDETGSCESFVTDNCIVNIADQLISLGLWDETFANALLAGSVIERTNKKGQVSIEIFARMIDNTSKETLMSVDLYAEKIKADNRAFFSQGLSTKIFDAFPLIDSNITQVNGEKLSLSITKKDRIWERMPLLIYQLENNISCGNATLVDVKEQLSTAILRKVSCNNINSATHRAITR